MNGSGRCAFQIMVLLAALVLVPPGSMGMEEAPDAPRPPIEQEPMIHTICPDENARLVREAFRASGWGWLRLYQDLEGKAYVSWEFADGVLPGESSLGLFDDPPTEPPSAQDGHDGTFDDMAGYCRSVGTYDPEFWVQAYIVSESGSLPIETQARSACADTYVYEPTCIWVYRIP